MWLFFSLSPSLALSFQKHHEVWVCQTPKHPLIFQLRSSLSGSHKAIPPHTDMTARLNLQLLICHSHTDTSFRHKDFTLSNPRLRIVTAFPQPIWGLQRSLLYIPAYVTALILSGLFMLWRSQPRTAHTYTHTHYRHKRRLSDRLTNKQTGREPGRNTICTVTVLCRFLQRSG